MPLVLSAINAATGPTLARLHSKGEHANLARVVRMSALAGAAGAGATLLLFAFLGHAILNIVFGFAYLAAWAPLMVLCIGQFTNAAMGPVGLVLNMTGHEKDTTVGFMASALANVALNAVLIPRMGLLGAALATSTSTVLWNVVLAWRVKRRLGFLPVLPAGGNS